MPDRQGGWKTYWKVPMLTYLQFSPGPPTLGAETSNKSSGFEVETRIFVALMDLGQEILPSLSLGVFVKAYVRANSSLMGQETIFFLCIHLLQQGR